MADFGLVSGVCGMPFWVFDDCVGEEVVGGVVDKALADKVIFWKDIIVKRGYPIIIRFVIWDFKEFKLFKEYIFG